MTPHTHTSPRAGKRTLTAARGGIEGKLRMVEANTNSIARAFMVESACSFTSPIKQETPVLADGGFSNSRKGGYPMRKLVISCHFTTTSATRIPRILMNSGIVCVTAVLS